MNRSGGSGRYCQAARIGSGRESRFAAGARCVVADLKGGGAVGAGGDCRSFGARTNCEASGRRGHLIDIGVSESSALKVMV